jgi:hypothetical protein
VLIVTFEDELMPFRDTLPPAELPVKFALRITFSLFVAEVTPEPAEKSMFL